MKCSIKTLSLLLASLPVWSCELCKEILPTGMAKGFYWSILLMLAVPAIVVAVITGTLWRAGKKRRGLPNAHHGRSS
jgi:hypothetical protein